MIEVGEHFVLLEAQVRDVAGSQLLTRAIGVEVGGRDALAAIDSIGQKHLLIPVMVSDIDEDLASRGVTLESRVLRTASGDVTYADLHCRISSLALVFERLVEDILERLVVDDSAPVSTCRKVLDDWRALLRAAGQDVTRETVIGLVGELEVLRLLAAHNPVGALDAWQGPSKSVHDFARSDAELEVKTTTSVDGNFVSISNIDQLDPEITTSLHLVIVHAREDSRAPSLDERIDELARLSVPRDALLTKVSHAGYIYGSGVSINDRLRVRSVRAWIVDSSFPGLRRTELGEIRLRGVSKIRYELALDSVPKRLSDKEFDHLMGTWVGLGE
ncbi:MAG TPA: PD-(D/E)XK motif protein [Streptosporangiaceae bacterium]|nr:PD-(D/E)XK motif protein [Streptosporangiaceae bacterium]